MTNRIKVTHLFDHYLPHTMNWAYQMMRATPHTAVSVASPLFVRNKYFDADFYFYVRPLQQWGWFPPSEWTASRLQGLVVRAERYIPAYKYWLEKQLEKHRPDVLHAHFAPVGWHYLDMAKRLNIPLVVSFYGYDYESLPARNKTWPHRYQQLFKDAAAVTCAGPHGQAVLMRQGLVPEKITILPMSMNPREFPFRPRVKTADRLRLVQVATITEKKGFMDTLHALNMARKTCPNLHLAIAGERHDRNLVQQMEAFIRANALQPVVQWLDFLPHPELSDFFTQFDIFIQPSHYAANRDCEGGPVSILEAQATGLPVIATTHFDIPSEVRHDHTGLLAPERDMAALARHIERFYRMDDPEYQQFSVAARRHVEMGFDIRNTSIKLVELYKKVVPGIS